MLAEALEQPRALRSEEGFVLVGLLQQEVEWPAQLVQEAFQQHRERRAIVAPSEPAQDGWRQRVLELGLGRSQGRE